ncbi:MAG: hypothetical protein AAGN35_00785 [Bacteroidota bacterium]
MKVLIALILTFCFAFNSHAATIGSTKVPAGSNDKVSKVLMIRLVPSANSRSDQPIVYRDYKVYARSSMGLLQSCTLDNSGSEPVFWLEASLEKDDHAASESETPFFYTFYATNKKTQDTSKVSESVDFGEAFDTARVEIPIVTADSQRDASDSLQRVAWQRQIEDLEELLERTLREIKKLIDDNNHLVVIVDSLEGVIDDNEIKLRQLARQLESSRIINEELEHDLEVQRKTIRKLRRELAQMEKELKRDECFCKEAKKEGHALLSVSLFGRGGLPIKVAANNLTATWESQRGKQARQPVSIPVESVKKDTFGLGYLVWLDLSSIDESDIGRLALNYRATNAPYEETEMLDEFFLDKKNVDCYRNPDFSRGTPTFKVKGNVMRHAETKIEFDRVDSIMVPPGEYTIRMSYVTEDSKAPDYTVRLFENRTREEVEIGQQDKNKIEFYTTNLRVTSRDFRRRYIFEVPEKYQDTQVHLFVEVIPEGKEKSPYTDVIRFSINDLQRGENVKALRIDGMTARGSALH